MTLISSPGELLERTAAREGVEAIGLPMERGIAPLADLVSLARLWWLLLRLQAGYVANSARRKPGFLGSWRPGWRGARADLHAARA